MNDYLHKGASGKLFEHARKNRSNQTRVEKLLWDKLRNRKLDGFKFRRQHPVKAFIADFYCHGGNLIVEVDGEYHGETEQMEYDRGRTYELEELGLSVIRFKNREVEKNIELVLKEIREHLNPSPSPQGEGSI